ncbi:unnamed protein product [Dibothriocephalus latus]|uniref:Uncharacterized protein n=1 Tax=Dibothriocephalus latus TaxID=60516 RepID=A0A3P6SRV1_DIBLA|nr:unnamed protein product [Dibothriocephalus latus]
MILWQTSVTSVSRLRQIFVDGVSQGGGKICALRFREVGDGSVDDHESVVRPASPSESSSDLGLDMLNSEARGDEDKGSQNGTVNSTDEAEEVGQPMEVDEPTEKKSASSWSPTVVEACNGAVLRAREKLELSVGIIGADGSMSVRMLSPFSAWAADCLLGHPNATAAGVQLAPIFQGADGLCLASAAGSTSEDSGDVRLWRLGSKDSSSCNSEQPITHSRAVTTVLRLIDRERYMLSSSLDGSIIVWTEEEICGETVWTARLKMLLYDADADDVPPSPISAMDLLTQFSPNNESAKSLLLVLCGNRLYSLAMNLRGLKSVPVSKTLWLSDLKEHFALKTIGLPVAGFSLAVAGLLAVEESSPTVLVGTGSGFLLSVTMSSTPTVQKQEPGVPSQSNTSGLITPLLPLRQGFISLCGGALAKFDHQGSFVSGITLPEGIDSSILTHLAVPTSENSYVIVARRISDGETERSFITLLSSNGTPHSSYTMPKGTQVTALRSSELKFGRVNETEVLTVVGSSDGLVRFLLFDLRTPSNLPRLVGFLPCDRKVTSIDCVSSSSFCAGFENGDIGVYYFSPDYRC